MKDLGVHLSLVTLFAIVVRWAISLHPYSGAGKPPMFGDYEAQRHWMEITYNLPVKDWYHNTTDNDLQYWGLDYPPLTAYHSWALGAVAHRINSSWVELHESRGFESYDHKLFMRYSVLVADIIVYIPAVFAYFLSCTRLSEWKNQLVFSSVVLLYPGLMLIDYGHFQYNCVSLGLALWGVIGLCKGHDLLGSIAFVLSLNYKQMELYHALPFFSFLFGSCLCCLRNNEWKTGIWKLVKIAAVVLATFVFCWMPFLGGWSQFSQVLHRLFPFARGLFEDKVANVWCSLSILIKFKEVFSISSMLKICLSTTLLFTVPSSLDLIFRPSVAKFKYSLVNVSLVFFLFSFQVHEKSILLTALPVCLLLPDHLFACVWFLLVSTFSMLPLLIKDGLVLAYLASSVLFYLLADVLTCDEFQVIMRPKGDAHAKATVNRDGQSRLRPQSRILQLVFMLSVIGMAILTAVTLTMQPPKRFPDLFSVAVSSYSCLHFVTFLVYFHWRQFRVAPGNRASSTPGATNMDFRTVKKSKKIKSN